MGGGRSVATVAHVLGPDRALPEAAGLGIGTEQVGPRRPGWRPRSTIPACGAGGLVVGLPFPNPTAGVAWVPVSADGPVHVEVFDALGRRVLTHEARGSGGTVAVGPLAPGSYLVRVSGGGHRATRGVTVVR